MTRQSRLDWFPIEFGAHQRSAIRATRRLVFEMLESRRMMAAFDVLVFSKTAEFRHDSIDEGVAAIQALGAAHDFSVVHTEDAAAFTDANLAQYEAVVFLNTTGDVLNAAQETALQNYIHAGGGFAGVHSAADTEHGWTWYGDLVGAYFASHPAIQEATIKVADHVHASTADLPDRWVRTDEWYNYTVNPRGNVHVLATLDETTYTGGTEGFDHPISWYKYFEGGRSWYTGLGHTASSYSEPLFLDHLLGGIEFAAGRAPADLGGTIDANWHKAELATGLSNPISLTVAPSGDVYFVELGGKLKIYHPSTGLTTTAATLNVFAQGEDGLLGIALDPNFAQNQWVYLYYSPAGPAEVQHLSRFTMNGSMLDLSSEKVVLEIPVNRVQSGQSDGHSAGSLAFGPVGVLYVSVGDDTVPFESSGYAPIDEQAGRQRFDAQRSSANTNDLRGKILRIKPEVDGSYSIPAGNLFPGDATHRPEIFIMGNRNPYRISVDAETGWLYWGDVGPDANNDSATRGPRGYDELNQAREAGNYGWPYIIADNKAYHDFNFATSASGPLFNPAALENDSPNNTGSLALPAAKPAFIWYPYAASSEFPELGSGSRTIMAGPVYHFDPQLSAENKLPEYFDDTLIMFDWSRSWFWEVKLDQNGQLLKINRIFSDLTFKRPIETELGPDGALYVLEWGTNFGGNNPDAKLVRVDFVGNLPNLGGDYNKNNLVDAADYTVWRDTLGQSGLTPFTGADGSGNGVVDQADYDVWQAHFGQTVNNLPGDYNHDNVVNAADYCVWRDTLGSTTDLRADGNGNGHVDQPDYDRWRADFGNTLPPASDVGSMLSTGASNGEAAAARSASADKASPITASAQAVDRALTDLGGGMPVRGSERFTLAVHADRRMAAQQADANLLLLAVARSAPTDADADDRLGAPTHDQELDAARQFERWGEIGIEWDVGRSSLSQQLVNPRHASTIHPL